MSEESGEGQPNVEINKKWDHVVYGLQDGFSIDRYLGNDVAYDHILDDAEKKLGHVMQGDRELAKFYMDKFVEGVAVAFKRKGKEHLISKIRFGFVDDDNVHAMAQIFGRKIDDKDIYAPCVFLNIKTLDDMSFFDSDQEYFHYQSYGKDESSMGPAWYAAREMGVEEGAHILYMFEHGAMEKRNKRARTWAKYHEQDIEFDGLNERIIDTEEILRDDHLTGIERFQIRGVLTRFKRTLQKSHVIRSRRNKDPKKIDLTPYTQQILSA